VIAAVASLAAAAVAVLLLLGGGSASGTAGTYGGLPSWLPKARQPVGQVLHASLTHPALSVQGETVAVSLPQGHLLVTAVGPETPEQGRFPVPPATPCTFVVTFADASRAMRLRTSAIYFLDERGAVHLGHVTAMNGGAPPETLSPGRSVSVEVHAFLPTGDGALNWSPIGARRVASWDFTVEID